MKYPLTALIPTYNEIEHIEAVIQSVSFAQEILVVDSFSKDGTAEKARELGATVIQRAYDNSASQKNWAIPQAQFEWIILVDADERVPPALQNEIVQLLQGNHPCKSYWIYRSNIFMGKRIRFSGWQGDKVVRFFHRDFCKYEEKHVHAEVITNGKVGVLNHKLDHLTYKGLRHWLDKSDWYTTWGAYDRSNRIKKVGFFQLVFKPFFTFFRDYILRFGFLDGKVGFILCAQASWYVFFRAVKIWRINEGEVLPRKK